MKFIHISDVHLGVAPDAGSDWSEKRKHSIWDTFAETVAEAGRRQVDFLLISGDLFHRQPLKRELKEVNYLFGKIPNVKVLLMAGNHDYMQPKSYYRGFEWAENVSFFEKEEVTAFDFPEENVTVYGMSYWHRELPERLYDQIRIADHSRINILLAHGKDERHIPFSSKELVERGFDYVAAGHIHKGGQLVEKKAVMAGALEPTDCNDTGAHGYWMGEIQKNGRNVETELYFCPIKKCEYRHETVAVSSATTQYELENEIRKLVASGENYMLYRIFLEGYVDPDYAYDMERLTAIPQIVDITEHLKPDYDFDKILSEQPDSLLGRYITRMQKLPQNRTSKKALEYGVNALLGHRICK